MEWAYILGKSQVPMLYLVVIPWAQVVCLIYTPEAQGPQA